MKALFSNSALYTAKSFTTKFNFVTATAKKLSIKKSEAFEIADKIEASTDEVIEPNAFKTMFIDAATKAVQEKLLAQIPAEKVETV